MARKRKRIFRRKKHRLPEHDYRADGHYFVTIITNDRRCYFGRVKDNVMVANDLGQAVIDAWLELAVAYDYVSLDEWQLMPNHFHGILVMGNKGSSVLEPGDLSNRKPVGRLIGRMKTVATNRIEAAGYVIPRPLWQPDYYDEIIRNEAGLNRVRAYIRNNPLAWSMKR